ncbi:MAG: hypothetical protein IK041_02570, partial [Bacteroidales bacterium]|nr:hypothetical protein [Bacteroidales bacterium]
YTDSDIFSSVEGKPLTNKEYWSILMDACTECGAKNNHSHTPDCVIGRSYKWYKEYSDQGKKWDAIRMRDNIVQLKLSTAKGKAMLAAMRNQPGSKPSTSTTTNQRPTSTSLKDYTPAPEKPKPAVGNPVMPRPIMVRTPEFSGINEHSIVYDKPQSIDGEHPWGTVDMNAFRQSQKGGWGVFADYDIERYTNTPKGVVILGKRQSDGHILWMGMYFDKDSGKYRAYEIENEEKDMSGKKVTLKDIRFEAEGEILVREYSDGYKKVTNVFGKYIAFGYNIKVLPMKVDGHRIIAHGQDPTRKNMENKMYIYDDTGKEIAHGEELEYFDDAIIARSKGSATLYNWKGQSIYFDKGGWTSNYMDEIQAFTSDKGRYYVIKVKEGRYALETQDFRSVGGFYSSAQEAHDAWNRW